MRAALLLVMIALAGCATAPASDPTVAVNLRNDGARPMQCRIQFGHWVARDLGVLAPGVSIRFDIQQQPKDGALYIERDDGQRRMMIENILCARKDDWQATVGQIDLASVRTARPDFVSVLCALPASGGHVVCQKPRLINASE